MLDLEPESEVREVDTMAPPTDVLPPTSNPQIDEETFFNMKDPMARKFVEEVAKPKDAARRAKLAKPGALGLPPLLEKRRLEHLIPDEAFREQPIFDRIFVHQVSMHGDSETYGDTPIIMTSVTQDSEKFSNPRGILVAAGPIALDELRSNGVELGHVITFIKLAPWRLQVTTKGRDDHVLIMRSCDVIGSEDLARSLRDGTKSIQPFTVEKDGRTFTTHVIANRDKEAGVAGIQHPMQPNMPEDM